MEQSLTAVSDLYDFQSEKLSGGYENEMREFADNFLEQFMIGYNTENQIDETWTNHLHQALKLFEFIHYNAFNMDYELAGKGTHENLPERTNEILKRYRQSIEKDLPYIEHTFCPYK